MHFVVCGLTNLALDHKMKWFKKKKKNWKIILKLNVKMFPVRWDILSMGFPGGTSGKKKKASCQCR